MYFDAVINRKTKQPVFNGTPEEVQIWLRENEDWEDLSVCRSETMKLEDVEVYLQRKF